MRRVLMAAMLACAGAAQSAPEDDYQEGRRAFFAGDMAGASVRLQRAADQGHAPAQALYGRLLRQTDADQALAYLRKAAAQGNPEAQFELGSMHAVGESVPRDAAEARRWFERAGRGGYRAAIVALADAYLRGGLDLDDAGRSGAEALEWIRLAAQYDHLPALVRLARAYREGGLGLTADPQRAAALEAKARELRGRKPAGSRR